jgi:hypothetical protein
MSSMFDRNPEYELERGQNPTRKVTQRREYEEEIPKTKTSEQQWEKSFHAITKEGPLKLSITRFEDGTLEGTYKLQGRSIQALKGEVQHDENQNQEMIKLVDSFGARWHGQFLGDQTDQLVFSNITLPGITDGHPVLKLQDVSMGTSEIATEQTVKPPMQPNAEQSASNEQELEPMQGSNLETWQKTPGKEKTWRETGKLRGNPPVRDEKTPPQQKHC